MAVDGQTAITLARAAVAETGKNGDSADVVLCPPFVFLSQIHQILGSTVALGAQDIALPDHPNGAQTGDVSPRMVAEVGARYVIIGHSERRARYGESNALVRAKAVAAIAAGLVPIICVGETADQRAAGQGVAVIENQLSESLPADFSGIVAYEPVWAISGGQAAVAAATLDDISNMHSAIHDWLVTHLANHDNIRMVYGGSVKGANVAEILALPHVDGALVGRASMMVEDLRQMIQVASTLLCHPRVGGDPIGNKKRI